MKLVCGLDIPSDSDFRVFYCMSCGSPTPVSPNDSVITKSKSLHSVSTYQLSFLKFLRLKSGDITGETAQHVRQKKLT